MYKEYFSYIILIVGTLLVVSLISFVLRKSINFFIKKNSQDLHADPTNFIFLKNSISFILYSIGTFWIIHKIPYFKSLGAALFASAGILAAVLGFASQKAVANIIGGIFVLIFKPFRVGDIIETSGNHRGVIEEITLRHTVVRDVQHRRIIIPNSVISEDTIINSSIIDKKIRRQIDIGVAYDCDLDLASSILRDIIISHPNFIDTRDEQMKSEGRDAVPVNVVALGDFSITLRTFVWTQDTESAIQLHWDTLKRIKEEYAQHGIEIPYPYRTVVLKKDSKTDAH